MMILAVDVGNSNIVFACMEDDKIRFTARFRTDRNKTDDEYALMVMALLTLHKIEPAEIEGSIIACVVPSLRGVMQSALEKITGSKSLIVGAGLKTGLNIRIDNPAQLGSDLVVNAIAACDKYQKPILVFDMGTATTLSVIDRDGNYLGGMIMPGMQLSIDALSARASHLPNISFDVPQQVIGTNTVNCMLAGAVFGHAAMLDGIAQRTEDVLGEKCTIVATGGLASQIVPHCYKDILYDEHLLLRGLRILYEKNRHVCP